MPTIPASVRIFTMNFGMLGNSVSASGPSSGLLMMSGCIGTTTLNSSILVILRRSLGPAALAGIAASPAAPAAWKMARRERRMVFLSKDLFQRKLHVALKPGLGIPDKRYGKITGQMRRWTVVGLLFFGILISYIDRGNLGLAAPRLMHEFSLSPASMGTLLSSFFWTYGAFQIPSGYLVDRFGIRVIYGFAFLIWSLASAGVGLARTPGEILVLRLVLGAAESVGPLASLAYIKRNFEEKRQGLPTAIYISGLTMGPAVGTLLGGALLQWQDWRGLFLLTGLAGCLWLPLW